MAIKKIEIRPKGDGTYPDTLYPRTSIDQVDGISDGTSHVPYTVDTGTANSKIVSVPSAPATYKEGMAFAFRNAVQNTSTVVVNVNGMGTKAIVKSNGGTLASGNLKVGSIYTVRYNGTSFILQGEGGEYGTATANDVLATKTIGTETGVVPGTIPTFTSDTAGDAVNGALTPGRVYIRPPKGYWDASAFTYYDDANFNANNILGGKSIFGLAGNITNYSRSALGQGYAQAVSARGDGGGSLVLEPLRGYYEPGLNANGYGSIIIGDGDFISGNIKAGVDIFGVVGTATASSLGGAQRYASGTVTSAPATLPFRLLEDHAQTTTCAHASVSLDFEPDLIFLMYVPAITPSVTYSSTYTNRNDKWARAVTVANGSHYQGGGQGSGRMFRGDTDNAYVNTTGFRIPVPASNVPYKWFAVKY